MSLNNFFVNSYDTNSLNNNKYVFLQDFVQKPIDNLSVIIDYIMSLKNLVINNNLNNNPLKILFHFHILDNILNENILYILFLHQVYIFLLMQLFF